METGVVLALEHPPVFTLGRRGERRHLCVSESFLQNKGIDLVHAERGGDITYHGPGQLVVYPIVNLKTARLAVSDFVSGLEEIMILTALNSGVPAERSPINRGVFVGPKKLGSIGIAVRRGISFHGLALNVNTDLAPFQWIHPCGLENVKMTSLQQETSKAIPMSAVRRHLTTHMKNVFHIDLAKQIPDHLARILAHLQETAA